MMKFLSFTAALLLIAGKPAFALTEADITPAALVGKTLRFTVTNGAAPLPATGIWTGTFAASGNGFAVGDISSGIPAISTTYTATLENGVTQINLPQFGATQDLAYIYLYFVKGVPTYGIQAFAGASEGTFTIDPTAVNEPEIDVQQPKNSPLTDGLSKKSFGTVKVTKTGAAQKFVIKNTGSAPLKNLAITVGGRNKSDFIVSSLKKNQLAEDESIEFTVKFKPAAAGTRKASLHIKSNDGDENPFDVTLTGTGARIK